MGEPFARADWLGAETGPGQVVGLDVSDEMIRRARATSTAYDNILFVVGSAQQIPWQEDFFDKVLSVESFYYYGDQGGALDEVSTGDGARRRTLHPDQLI